MTLQFLLDTDTCVYWLRGRESVRQHMLNADPTVIVISIITLAELRYGAACSAQPDANNQAIDTFTGAIAVIGIDALVAQRFADIKADLRRRGALLEDSDLFIAATALTLGVTLVTNNQEHFRRVPQLKLENWA
jgi:tRNA(fMet)-specific endonuclease VapC